MSGGERRCQPPIGNGGGKRSSSLSKHNVGTVIPTCRVTKTCRRAYRDNARHSLRIVNPQPQGKVPTHADTDDVGLSNGEVIQHLDDTLPEQRHRVGACGCGRGAMAKVVDRHDRELRLKGSHLRLPHRTGRAQ